MATRLEIAHQPIMNVVRQLETLLLLKERLMLDTVKGFRKIHSKENHMHIHVAAACRRLFAVDSAVGMVHIGLSSPGANDNMDQDSRTSPHALSLSMSLVTHLIRKPPPVVSLKVLFSVPFCSFFTPPHSAN